VEPTIKKPGVPEDHIVEDMSAKVNASKGAMGKPWHLSVAHPPGIPFFGRSTGEEG
jgi:hypothetical protein|tara:strand:+ start:418 stop:585 length:168 start_codon:yes stop_codon:yes gene_type:complete